MLQQTKRRIFDSNPSSLTSRMTTFLLKANTRDIGLFPSALEARLWLVCFSQADPKWDRSPATLKLTIPMGWLSNLKMILV